MRTRWVLGFVFSALAFSACARTEELSHGGETNWLRACESDGDCAIGSCLCGVCTTTCEGAGDCDGAYVGSCIDADSRIGVLACDGPARVAALCLPGCAGDRDCGDGFACREGTCVTSEVAAKVDQPDIEVVKDGCKLQPCAEMTTSAGCDGLDMARQLVSPCFAPGLTPFYEAQCGSYRAIVEQGIDSAVVHYYDAAGKAKGQSENGFGASSCKAYEPGFRPEDCEIVTPNCSDEEPPLVMDAGPPEPRDGSPGPDAMCTLMAEAPVCLEEGPFCRLESARALVPECRVQVLTPYHAVRCGEYDGVVAQGLDSRNTFFYGTDGSLVGENEEGLGATGCKAYDPSFRLQPCEIVTPDCPQGACDCGAEEQSLACFCSFNRCPTFADATGNPFCEGGGDSNPNMVERGCGWSRVRLLPGDGSMTLVYQGPDHILVGAAVSSAVTFGDCEQSSYRTALPDLQACDDYSVCSLCDSTGYEKCEP